LNILGSFLKPTESLQQESCGNKSVHFRVYRGAGLRKFHQSLVWQYRVNITIYLCETVSVKGFCGRAVVEGL